MEHNIVTEWADVFECSCGYKYEGPNRSAVENAHLYVNHFIDDESPRDRRGEVSEQLFRATVLGVDDVLLVAGPRDSYFSVNPIWNESEEKGERFFFPKDVTNLREVFTTDSPTSPDPLASIAESLEKLSHPWVTPNSESEKFFRHLNNGEVAIEAYKAGTVYLNGDPCDQLGYRITITEKGLPA